MTWLTEDPTPLVYTTIVIQLVLLVALMQTKRVVVLAMMGIVLAVLGLVYAVDAIVVTEREEVATVLDEMIDAAEAGDKERLLTHVDEDAKPMRQLISRVMKVAKIEKVSYMKGPEIVVNNLASPPAATADFKFLVRGEFAWFAGQHMVEAVLHFDHLDDRWQATSVEHDSRIP